MIEHLTVARAVGVASAYWLALVAASLFPADSDTLVPILLLAGLPLMVLCGMTLWRAGNGQATGLAYTDELTGLHNRRAFTLRAMELIGEASPGSASLVLVDVDGLKKINDDCGHLAGDELLSQVAIHLARMGNTVYRVGGDEFAILVNRHAGESVTALMRALTPLTYTFRTCGHEHVIQFSYGFASRRDQEGFESVFSRADARLRQFKYRLYSSGRRMERRLTSQAAEAEIQRLVAEAEADDKRDDSSTVVSIFSRTRRPGPSEARSANGE